MAWNTLQVEDVGTVRWIRVNRPDKLNALNGEVLAELEAALAAARSEAAVRALVLSGVGEKAFVAGADIAEFEGLSAEQAQAAARRGQRLFDAVEGSRIPVIAAVNGFALGGGCELAMSCHLRVASTNARFGQPEVKLGLIPGYGGTQRLPRLVGRGRALELLLSGAMIDAPTALAWGLVNRVVDPAELAATAQQLAEGIVAVSPAAVAGCLEAVAGGADRPLAGALELEAALFGRAVSSEDGREGVAAFLAKRPAKFPGR
ncbi:MAG: enoyl-CoA hydratase [Acidobacteria bacterium]|nr:enoyl-CoA hydratase [Acidobacteriota bacterium]